MAVICVLIWLLMAVATIAITHVKYSEVESVISKMTAQKQSLKQLQNQKKSPIQRYFDNIRSMLYATKSEGKFNTVLIASLALGMAGGLFGLISKNLFLVPCFVVAFGAIPALWVQFKYLEFQRQIADQLAIALSTITASYERSNNMLLAFEENLNVIEYPARRMFEDFVSTAKYVNPNLQSGLAKMKSTVNNAIFIEWCEAMINCINDSNMRFVLSTIVSKFTRIKIVISKNNNLIKDAKRNSTIAAIINVLLMAAMIFWMPQSMGIDVNNMFFNLLIALDAVVLLYCVISSQIIARSISYDL